MQLILRPERCDGRRVDLGAYVALDSPHGLGFLEYGLSVEEGSTHIIDSSPIGFDLSSLRCRGPRTNAEPLLSPDQIRSRFAKRKASYAWVRATFERDSTKFDGGRICDITEVRVLTDAD